jgi:hypothetical protein
MSASTSATRATRSCASPSSGAATPARTIRRRRKEQYALVWSDAESQAYYAALKARFKATVNESALASREAAASAPS